MSRLRLSTVGHMGRLRLSTVGHMGRLRLSTVGHMSRLRLSTVSYMGRLRLSTMWRLSHYSGLNNMWGCGNGRLPRWGDCRGPLSGFGLRGSASRTWSHVVVHHCIVIRRSVVRCSHPGYHCTAVIPTELILQFLVKWLVVLREKALRYLVHSPLVISAEDSIDNSFICSHTLHGLLQAATVEVNGVINESNHRPLQLPRELLCNGLLHRLVVASLVCICDLLHLPQVMRHQDVDTQVRISRPVGVESVCVLLRTLCHVIPLLSQTSRPSNEGQTQVL